MTRVISVLGKAGKTGSLYKSLKAISDQVSTRVIVVRVAKAEAGENKPTQSQLIIGGTQADEMCIRDRHSAWGWLFILATPLLVKQARYVLRESDPLAMRPMLEKTVKGALLTNLLFVIGIIASKLAA